jgi:hypothetical protein
MSTEWQGPKPALMSIPDLFQWFERQNFSPDSEIGKVNYAYADPVADAHNWRDRQKKWHWTFSNIQADVWDEENDVQTEIGLDEAYRMLYELLGDLAPHPENFRVPLLASAFKDALIEVQRRLSAG